jgi:hypothetical protein
MLPRADPICSQRTVEKVSFSFYMIENRTTAQENTQSMMSNDIPLENLPQSTSRITMGYTEPPISYEESVRMAPESRQRQQNGNALESPPEYTSDAPPSYEEVITRTLKRRECWVSLVILFAVGIVFLIQFGIQYLRIPKLQYLGSSTSSVLVGTPTTLGYLDSSPALFSFPSDVLVHNSNVYFTDSGNHLIRYVSYNNSIPLDFTTRKTFDLAGVPRQSGYSDGVASAALFDSPNGVATDMYGNIIVADSRNCALRNISMGMVSTVWKFEPCTEPLRIISVACHSSGKLYFSTFGSSLEQLTPNNNGFDKTAIDLNSNGGLIAKVVIVGDLLYYTRQLGQIRTLDLSTLSDEPKNFLTTSGDLFYNRYGDGDVRTAALCVPLGFCKHPTKEWFYATSSCANLVKLLTPTEMKTISGQLDLGFKLGPPSEARYFEPAGIDFLNESQLVVVDRRNHILRIIDLIDI